MVCDTRKAREDVKYGMHGKIVRFSGVHQGEDREKGLRLVEQYREYKTAYAENIVFDSSVSSLSK